MRQALLLAAALALGIAAGDAAAALAKSGRIAVGTAATVEGRTVRLADVAVLEGNGLAFADVELGPAPDPGASRRLEGVAILRRLREAGLDATATRYEIPASVRVARAFQEIDPDTLRGAVEQQATRMLAAGESIRRVEVPGPVRIPPGPYELRVDPPAATARGARRRFDVALVQGGAVAATVSVNAEIVGVGPVVTLRRAVPRGMVLRAEDLTIEERDRAGVVPGIVTDLEQAVGKEARTALAAGAPLTTQALARPLLVRRGDVVTLIVETPGMRLSVAGEALEAGAAGAEVRVRNRASQQEIAGQVVERGTILVQY